MAKDWDTSSLEAMELTAKAQADGSCSKRIRKSWLEVHWDGKRFDYKFGIHYIDRDAAIKLLEKA